MSNVESPKMGRYCKAYLAKQFRQFPGWRENLYNLREEKDENDQVVKRTEIQEEDVLYLQEDYVVTDDIFKDRNIVFDQVDEQWQAFCHETLNFQIPDFVNPEEVK